MRRQSINLEMVHKKLEFRYGVDDPIVLALKQELDLVFEREVISENAFSGDAERRAKARGAEIIPVSNKFSH